MMMSPKSFQLFAVELGDLSLTDRAVSSQGGVENYSVQQHRKLQVLEAGGLPEHVFRRLRIGRRTA